MDILSNINKNVPKFTTPYGTSPWLDNMMYRGVASIFRGERTNIILCERRRREQLGGLGACSPRKCFNLGARKCHFLRFPGDIFHRSANLMIKKRLLPINIFFLRFQVYARACVRAYMVATLLMYVLSTITWSSSGRRLYNPFCGHTWISVSLLFALLICVFVATTPDFLWFLLRHVFLGFS